MSRFCTRVGVIILLEKDLKYIGIITYEVLTIKINEIKRKLYSLSKKLIA